MYSIDGPLVPRETTRRTGGQERARRVLGLLAARDGQEISITGTQLAALADTQREYASKAIAQACRDGALRRTGKTTLVVVDRGALQ